jgi:hypothetical protein
LLARRIVPSTPPGNFFRRFRTALGPGSHPGDESRRLSTVLRCAQYRMVAGPMGHGSRLCFRSGLAGVARARCRVECGALRSFINGKLLHMSDLAGGGIMAGSRPVAILARGRSSEAMAAGATGRTRHRNLVTDQTRSIGQLAAAAPFCWQGWSGSFARFAVTVTLFLGVTVTQLFSVATLTFVCRGVFCGDLALC